MKTLRFGSKIAALILAIAFTGCGVDLVSAKEQPAPTHLDAVLSQLDAASARFQSAQADLRQEIYTKVINDTDTQNGTVYFLRKNNKTQMGIKMPAQTVEFKDGILRVFNPGTNHIDQFSASGKNQQLAETLLALGFGGSGSDLKKAWTITDLGAEQMSDSGKNIPVEKLDLVSKDAKVIEYYTHITVWIDPTRAVTLKQVFYAASGGKSSGDTKTAIYTNIRLNQPVDTKPFAIVCKGKCS